MQHVIIVDGSGNSERVTVFIINLISCLICASYVIFSIYIQ